MSDYADTILKWLAANSEVLGVPAQNWMLVVGAAVLLYIIGSLVLADRR